MQALNSVSSSPLQPVTPVQPDTEVASTEKTRKLDPNKLDFRVMFEVKGRDAATIGRALVGAGLQGWTASAIAARDCSHEQLNEGGWQGWIRIYSPMSSIQDGALDGVQKALATVQATGAVPSKTGAMRFFFRRDTLDDKATTNLIKMHAANEDILYVLGQHGAEGRPLAHKASYAQSVATIAGQHQQQTSEGWASLLRAKNGFRLSDEDAKNWEIRYLDSVYDGPAVANTLQLMCGLVSAAAEGTTQWSGSHPAKAGVVVERTRWNALMRDAVPPATRHQLEAQFRQAGGQLPPGLSDAASKATSQLLSTGYSFSTPSGARLASAAAVQNQVESGDNVVVSTPQKIEAGLNSEQIQNFVMAESGNLGELPADVKTKLTQLRDLQSQGVNFQDGSGKPVLLSDLAVRPNEDLVVARSAAGQVILNSQNFGLKQLQESLNPAHASQSALTTALGAGYQMTVAGEPVTWAPQLAAGLQRGTLVARKDGVEKRLSGPAELETNVLLPIFQDSLTPDEKATCQAADALAAKGFQFNGGGQALTAGTLAFARSLAAPKDLKVTVPHANGPTPLPTPALLHTFLAIESGNDASLDDSTRHQLDRVKGLAERGYQFSNQQTEGDITSRSGAILSLLTPNQTLTVRVPGSQNRVPVQGATLEDLSHFEKGDLSAPLADAMALYPQLQAGTTIQMQDVNSDSKFVSCNPAELVASLSQNRPVGLLNSTFGTPTAEWTNARTLVTGADEFLNVGRQRLAGSTPDAEQQGTMQGFQDLLGKGVTGKVDGTSRAIDQSTLVPWLMNDHAGFQVHSPSGTKGSVNVKNWTDLNRLVDIEAGRSSEVNQPAVADSRLIENLRRHDVKFYTVKDDKKAYPLGLKSVVVDTLHQDGVQVRTPSLVWWRWQPCKKVTIRSSEELQKLSAKFHDPVQGLFNA